MPFRNTIGGGEVRKQILISAIAAIAMGAGAAATRAQTASSFDGFYVGAHGSYGKVADSGPEDIVGGLFGLHAGYNYVRGGLLFGIEGDYDWSDISYSLNETNGGLTTDISVEAKYFASIRGRIGWEYQRALFYATAGYGWSEVEAKVTFSGLLNGSQSQSYDISGAVLGGGIEYKFTDAFSARLEGLRYWGHAEDNDDDDGDRDDIETNVIRAGLSYHFR
jgi:outer membrane immunogenic protein